jgi:hypothetical protein
MAIAAKGWAMVRTFRATIRTGKNGFNAKYDHAPNCARFCNGGRALKIVFHLRDRAFA